MDARTGLQTSEERSWIDRVFPAPAGAFARAYPDAPAAAHGELSRFEFAGDARLLCPLRVISASPCPPLHTAFLAAGAQARQRRCTTDEALRLFREGYTISLEAAGSVHDGLLQLASGLAAALELERVIAPAITVSPAGAGTPIHFDGLEVVIVQIAGKKRWRYAPNGNLEAADFPHFPGESGPGARGGRSPGGELAVPPSAEFQTCVLEPGSALFLPRGWWHETHALEDSISATVRLPLDTRYTVVATELARRLRERPRWRQVLVSRAGAGDPRSPAALDELLSEALAELSAPVCPGSNRSLGLCTEQGR